MDASLARAAAAEQKHLAKLAKKQEERKATVARMAAAGSSSEPARYTKKIVATRERRKEFKKLQHAEDDEPVEDALIVQREDGRTVDYASAVEDIQIFLQDHGSEATLDEVRSGVGIDLVQPGLLEALRLNPRIEAIALATGERLKYRPPFGILNRGALAHLLSRTVPGGEVESLLRSELKPEETYPELDVDVDEMLAQGRCVRVELSDKKARDFALFGAPAGRQAIEEVRKLWHEERVPPGPALQDQLVARKLRTTADIELRKERKAALRRRQQEAEAQPNKRRTGRVTKWANTHLGDSEMLGELTGGAPPVGK